MIQNVFDKEVKKYFPKAENVKNVSVRYLGNLQQEHDIDISRVLLATSFCSDDVNTEITANFDVVFGPFTMGGLAGFPFGGDTAFGAFAHHVPDNGIPIILYGPHIGMTVEGKIGKIHRPRVNKVGDSCGALVKALKNFKSAADYEPVENEHDYQQYQIEKALVPYRDKFMSHDYPLISMTECAYEIINKRLRSCVERGKQEVGSRKLVLLGGISINTDYGVDDYFDVKDFEFISW